MHPLHRTGAHFPPQQCLVCLDDVLVYTATFSLALTNLWAALFRLQAAGHPDKCRLMQ